ncbi:MAG: formate dehydrogenase [Burkholderiaceae bacterium]|nr:formate dehydrogenase [Burkholderiaceae bacterium]
MNAVATAAAGTPRRLYVPRDVAALAVGADTVATALAAGAKRRGVPVEIVRTGSRGLFWLEPLVECDGPAGRLGFGPVTPEAVESLLDAGLLEAGEGAVSHALALGPVEDLPYLRAQQRLTFARMGVVDPRSIADYAAHDGWTGLRRALALAPAEIVTEVLESGLRGRGGAAFPTGVKWQTVAQAPLRPAGSGPAPRRYVVCNADEGDSGTFSDRMVMEGDPFMLIEGMAIAGLAVGATQGYVYIRSEYPHAIATMTEAIRQATAAGWLGEDVGGSGRAFHLEVRKAAGSYVCGEETALLESLEGRRGLVRAKPPLPALVGLFGQPTLVNNVISFAAVPMILARGAAFYRDFGVGRSRGTLPFQLAGNVRRGGLVELAFGVTLRQLVEDFGGGTASGRPVKAVQVGGPLGAYLPPSQWDVPIDYEEYTAIGAVVGHGGIVVHDDTANLAGLARYAMEFCAIESCGKCTPCRIGSTRGVEVIDRIAASAQAHSRDGQVALLRDLCDTMLHGSLCAMGGMTPYPVLSALDHYPEDFGLPAAATGPAGAPAGARPEQTGARPGQTV